MTDAHGPSLLTCLTCGTPIRSGKYCEECNAKLIRTLEGGKKAFAVEPKKTAEESKRKESRFHIKS
jgi:Flp pilus assembly protein CpaB